MKEFIAERKLLYSSKGSDDRNEFVIRIGFPSLMKSPPGSFDKENCFVCHIEFEGLNEPYPEAYGADSLQAVQFATRIDPYLKSLQKKYDFYYTTGEPYFVKMNTV